MRRTRELAHVNTQLRHQLLCHPTTDPRDPIPDCDRLLPTQRSSLTCPVWPDRGCGKSGSSLICLARRREGWLSLNVDSNLRIIIGKLFIQKVDMQQML